MKNKKEIIFLQVAAYFSILKVLMYGVAKHSHVWEDFSMYQIIRNVEFYSSDLFAKKFIPVAGPILQYVFQYIHDIPFTHLLIGFAGQFIICYLLLLIAYKYTNDYLVTFISCASMMLLFPSFTKFNFTILPSVSYGLFLSFRDWSTIMCLCSLLLFLNGRRLMSITLLGLNFFNHPTNTINIFILIFLTDLIIESKTKTRYLKKFYPYLIFLFPLLIKVFYIQSINYQFEPIAFNLHWQNVNLNEPDDISTLYFITNPVFRKYVIKYSILIILTLLLITFNNGKRISRDVRIAKAITILIPVLTISLALYERFFFKFFPDFLNDFIMPLELRRMWGVLPIFCLPIIYKHGFGYIKKIQIFNELIINKHIGMILLFLVISIPTIKPAAQNVNGLRKLINFNKEDPQYFYQISNDNQYFFGRDEKVMNFDERIDINMYYDICMFIRNETEIGASFVNPPYISDFRYIANRQGFAGEKNDGNYAGLNRKFASRYYNQIEMLTKVVYRNLDEPMFQGGSNYGLLRDGYLSLKKSDILRICKTFPNYDYFLTEINHLLDFPILYKNDSFVIYDLKKGK